MNRKQAAAFIVAYTLIKRRRRRRREARQERQKRWINRLNISSRSSSSSDSSTSHSRKSYKSRRPRSSSTERRRSDRTDRDRHGKYRRESKRTRHRRSRTRSRSRSRSRSYITEFTATSKRSSSSSSSSSSSYKKSSKKETTAAAKQAVLRNKFENELKLDSTKTKEIEPEVPVNISDDVLNELNQDAFEPKEFTSKAKDTIVIDLKKQTIKVPQSDVKQSEAENIFHHNLFQPEEVRVVKWLKELYSYRHRALQTGSTKN